MKYDYAKNEARRARQEIRMERLRAAALSAPQSLHPVVSRRLHRLLSEWSFSIDIELLIRDGACRPSAA